MGGGDGIDCDGKTVYAEGGSGCRCDIEADNGGDAGGDGGTIDEENGAAAGVVVGCVASWVEVLVVETGREVTKDGWRTKEGCFDDVDKDCTGVTDLPDGRSNIPSSMGWLEG